MWALLLAFALSTAAPHSAPGCPVQNHERRTVRSLLEDPDVYLWKSSGWLDRFQRGQWTQDQLLYNTVILRASTRVLIVSACETINPHIIGVRVLDGFHKGMYGWIDSHDIQY